MELPKSGSSSSTGYRWCSRDKLPRRDPQAKRLPRPFSKAMQPRYSHLMIMNFLTSWNMEYQRRGAGSLPYRDLIQWTKG
eukprot:5644167-Ditylum_brightwellii.AAC.1